MDPTFVDVMKYAGGAGSLGVVFGILYLVGMRMIRSLDKVTEKIEAVGKSFDDKLNTATLAAVNRHTEVKQAISDVREEFAELKGELQGRSMTPIEGVPIVNESGRPITNPGIYGLGKKRNG